MKHKRIKIQHETLFIYESAKSVKRRSGDTTNTDPTTTVITFTNTTALFNNESLN
jgi:hypothetical protein